MGNKFFQKNLDVFSEYLLSDRVGIIHKDRLIALGSVETLRDMTHNPSGNFEDIFLELTEDSD